MDLTFKKTNPCEACLVESCTIFRVGIVRLGAAQLVCCAASVALGAPLMWLNQGNAWAGMGCWMALPFLVSGCWNLINYRGRPRERFSPCTLFNLLSVVCAGFLFIYAAFLLDSAILGSDRPFPQYRYSLKDNPGPLIGIQVGLLLVSLVELVAAVWSASLSVGLICLCCQIKGAVFTIPYQDLDDSLPHGPDIVPDRTVLDSDPAGPDILPSYSPAAPRRVPGEYRPQEDGGAAPSLELEWDNFVGDEVSDLEISTGFGKSPGSVQYPENDYFGSSAEL